MIGATSLSRCGHATLQPNSGSVRKCLCATDSRGNCSQSTLEHGDTGAWRHWSMATLEHGDEGYYDPG